ncbi:MAG: radical SAM protein [Desulfobacteraceae bacterium]|nr:radical SAM protein [Desulfobacteraceae bacterium]
MPRDQKLPDSLVYGPVPSRRLGLSLGVDIVPYKTCTYDCIYCQIGRTRQTTVTRRPYIEKDRILAELQTRLDAGARPDYITVGGSGEPTLNSEIGAIIREIRRISTFPVAVLTNGSFLGDTAVQKDLQAADVVLPSFDGHDAESFQRINRPHADISFEKMVSGLAGFRKQYAGRIWLEIFIVSGINDKKEAMEALNPHLADIDPDRIHLNTAVRPPAEKYAAQVPADRLQALAEVLGPKAEVIAEFAHTHTSAPEKDMEAEILDMLLRRPCTAADIAGGMAMDPQTVADKMAQLTAAGFVEIRKSGDQIYYFRPGRQADQP